MLNYPKLILKFLDLRLNLLKKFYEEIITKLQENKNLLEKMYKEEEISEERFDDLLDSLVDDYQEQEEFENLASMLIVSHIYSILEYNLKLLVGNLLKKEGKLVNEKYKKWGIDDISEFFKKRGIDITQIAGYKECDILRLLVNDIKHNGAMVSKKLAKARGDVMEENELKNIKVSRDEVSKYSDAVKLFYSNLTRRLDKNFG